MTGSDKSKEVKQRRILQICNTSFCVFWLDRAWMCAFLFLKKTVEKNKNKTKVATDRNTELGSGVSERQHAHYRKRDTPNVKGLSEEIEEHECREDGIIWVYIHTSQLSKETLADPETR